MQFIWAFIIGGITGVLLILLMHFNKKTDPQTKKIFITFVVLFAISISYILPNPLTNVFSGLTKIFAGPKTKAETILEENFAKKIIELPEFKTKYGNLSGKNYEDGAQIGRELIQNGLLRVDDETLLKRETILNKMMAKADFKTCAALTSGKIQNKDSMGLLNQLGDDDITAWVDILYKAAAAELRSQPIPPTDTEKGIKILQDMIAKLSEEDAKKFSEISNKNASDEENCWSTKMFSDHILALSQADQMTVERYIINPENTGQKKTGIEKDIEDAERLEKMLGE